MFCSILHTWHFLSLLTQRCRLLAWYDLNLHPFGRFCGIGDYTHLSPPSRTASEICKVIIVKAYINLGKLPLNSSNSLFQYSITIVSTSTSVVLYFSSLKPLYCTGTISINTDRFMQVFNPMKNSILICYSFVTSPLSPAYHPRES